MKKIFFIFFIFISFLFAREDIASLLSDFAQEADLSNQTKQESAGFLIIYTRQDLDRMNVHYLKDIVDKIPFVRYNEDNAGLTSPFYTPYQPEPPDAIRVYVNDRELITPFSGNALKLFGQMSMGFIDHIEVYMGIPSQTLGIQPAWFIIKCYTKDPKREETTLAGYELGSYGTKEVYGYSAKNLSNFSYLAYVNNRNLKRETIYYKDNPLSKNKDMTNFYGQVQKNHLRFEMQASRGSLDNFYGQAPLMDPKENWSKYNYFYTGIYYDNKENGVKAFINFSQDKTDHKINTDTFLGVIPYGYFLYVYNEARTKVKEQVNDTQIYKTFKTKNNKLIIGIQSRYKYFKIDEMSYNNTINIKNSAHYNSELILSGFIENSYLLNRSNMITASIKYDKNFENGDVRDYKTLSGRLGYIYNNGKWISKTYAFIGETTPAMQTLFLNRVIYGQNSDPQKERKTAIATKLIYKTKKHTTSFLISHTVSKNSIYFDGRSYQNLDYIYSTEAASFRHTYYINPLNKIIFNAWMDISHKNGESLSNASKYYGGLITLFNTIGKFDLYNNITYKHWDSVEHDGWNLNSAVTYHYSRQLTLFVKGENILNSALKSNYFSVNPLNGERSYLNNVDSIDRRVWLGMEYQF